METEIKISVIVPAYNVAGYIEKCLNTLLEQSFSSFQIILVDDGSTDETLMILEKYAGKDHRIQVIHQENKGVSAARNLGLSKAEGEYILFFDGDDFCRKDTLEELYYLMKEKEADTILYGYYLWEHQQVKKRVIPAFSEGIYEGEHILKELATGFIGISGAKVNSWLKGDDRGLYVENPALWRVMVSREVIQTHKLAFDEKLKVGEDTIFLTRYLSYAKRCYVAHRAYYYQVIRSTSVIYQYERSPEKKLEEKKKLLDARQELTEDISKETGFDIQPFWTGTIVMSAIELSFLLSKKNKRYSLKKGYEMFISYVKDKRVESIVKEFYVGRQGGIRRIPFLFLKKKQYLLLFCAAGCMNLTQYEFKR